MPRLNIPEHYLIKYFDGTVSPKFCTFNQIEKHFINDLTIRSVDSCETRNLLNRFDETYNTNMEEMINE